MIHYVKRGDGRAWFERPEDMPPPLHRLLVGRGIASAGEACRFLNPDEGDLVDPMRLASMPEAAARIRAALDGRETICVYGDYDVDGVSAAAILAGYLKEQGADVKVYLPSRHHEGYGLNEAAIREIACWAKLLVTVDCGVTSAELVALAKALGLDVIVTDHHRPAGEAPDYDLPDCPVVNPLLSGYPFEHLCGAGVAWKLVWALGGRDAAMAWVDVAALAAVADVVSLTGENRIIVKLGLDAINAAARPGIAALVAAAGLGEKTVTAGHIAFQLAPRLNAGGRLGSAMRAYDLLAAPDAASAAPLAAELEAENAARRRVEQEILAGAEAQLRDFDFTAHRAVILAGKDWNPGVIGLAASRLVEKYHYPVVLLSDQGERLTGSCRSIEGVDIHAALAGCAHTLERFGGHRQAAGLTLAPENLGAFRAAMDAWLAANVDAFAYVPAESYDTEIDFGSVGPGLIHALEALQPTGFGNPAPVFRAVCQVVDARAVGAGGAHLKLTLAQGGHRLNGIAFRMGGRAETLPGTVDALFAPELNEWMGRVEAQLVVRALAETDAAERTKAKLEDESRLQCDFLTQILYNKRIVRAARICPEADVPALAGWLEEAPQGTLVLAAGLGVAAELLRQLAPAELDVLIGQLPDDPRAFNALCAWPAAGEIPRGYRRIVLAGVPGEFPLPAGAEVRRLPVEAGWTAGLPDLGQLREAYSALMRVARRSPRFETAFTLAGAVAGEAGISETAAQAALPVLADMGLFQLDLDARPVRVQRSGVGKAAPEDSWAWLAVQRWRDGRL